MSMRERAVWMLPLERFRPVKIIRKAGGYKPQVRRRRVRINHVSAFILSRPTRRRRRRR